MGMMTADLILIENNKLEIKGTGYEPKGQFLKNGQELILDRQSKAFKHIMFASALCSDATMAQNGKVRKILGDTTEGALIVMAEKAGYDYKQLRKSHSRLDERPFDSQRLGGRRTGVERVPGVAYRAAPAGRIFWFWRDHGTWR